MRKPLRPEPPRSSGDSKPRAQLEKTLAKGMSLLGHAVEGLIGRAKKAKESVVPSSPSVKPVVALEGQLSATKLKDILFFSVDKLLSQASFRLVDQSALEIGDGIGKLGETLKERGAGLVVQAEIGHPSALFSPKHPVGGMYAVQASIRCLPFEDRYFDFVLGNFVTPHQGDMAHSIREMSRLIAVGGGGILVDFHPFGLYAKRGPQRMKGSLSTIKGLEDYFRHCKASGLVVTDVKEAFLDDSVRSFFTTNDEKQAFRNLKDSPLLICLGVRKPA